jgi:hypothetical protein
MTATTKAMTVVTRMSEYEDGRYSAGLTYWSGKGRYEKAGKALQKMIPASGSVDQPKKNPRLEKFRKASNCYYDLYNNGLGNRAGEFSKVFGIRSSIYKYRDGRYGHSYERHMYDLVEAEMSAIIAEAAAEQGIDLETGESLKPESKSAWYPTGKVGKSLVTGESTFEMGEVDAEGRWTGSRMWVSMTASHDVHEVDA